MPTSLLLTPREELLWLAALLEGEGCFSTNGKMGYPRIVLSMTDEDTVRLAYARAGVGRLIGPYKGKEKHHKSFWIWRVYNREHVFSLCRVLLPHMSIRRSIAIEKLLSKSKPQRKPLWEKVEEWER